MASLQSDNNILRRVKKQWNLHSTIQLRQGPAGPESKERVDHVLSMWTLDTRVRSLQFPFRERKF